MTSVPSEYDPLQEATSLIRSGRSAEAIPLLDSIIESGEHCLWAFKERGLAKQFTKDFEGAIHDYSLIVKLWPEDPRGFTSRANVRRILGDLEGAVDDYSSAIQIDRQHEHAYFHRGRVKVQLGDLVGAIDDFSVDMTYSRMGPLSGLLNRGEAKHRLGDFSGAINDLTTAIEIDSPSPILAPLLRGRVWASTRDWNRAIEDFTLALASFPGLTNALRERAVAKLAIRDEAGATADLAAYNRLGGQDLPAYA